MCGGEDTADFLHNFLLFCISTCQVCGCRSFPSISTLLSHVRVVHANEASFFIQCNLQGCHRTFKKFNTVPVSMDSMEDGSDMNDFDADTDN